MNRPFAVGVFGIAISWVSIDTGPEHSRGVAAPIRIRVVDEAQRPIAGAVAYRCAPRARYAIAAPGRELVLGRSDAQGNLELRPQSASQPASDQLIVGAVGFVPRALEEEPRPSGESVVTLRAAESLRVKCVDPSDAPLAGVALAISRTAVGAPIGEIAPGVELLAGATPETSVHSAVSDASGVATFASLTPGSYAFVLRSPRYAVIGGDLEFKVPAVARKIVLAPMWAAVVRVDGRAVLSSTYRAPVTSDRGTALTWMRTNRLREKLERTYPNAAVVVLTARADAPPVAEVTLLLSSGVEWTRSVTLRDCESPDLVQTLKAEPAPGGEVASRECVFEVLDSNSRPIPDLRFRLEREASRKAVRKGNIADPLGIDVVSESPLRLPEGKYAVEISGENAVRGLSPARIEVTDVPQQRFMLRLDVAMRRCRFVMPGLPGANASVDLETSTGIRGFLAEDLSALSYLMPLGYAGLSAKGFGFRVEQKNFIVEPARDDSEQLVELTPTIAK